MARLGIGAAVEGRQAVALRLQRTENYTEQGHAGPLRPLLTKSPTEPRVCESVCSGAGVTQFFSLTGQKPKARMRAGSLRKSGVRSSRGRSAGGVKGALNRSALSRIRRCIWAWNA